MISFQKNSHFTIWAFAFGYFIFYAPYSAAVKATSKSLWPGMEGPLTRMEILPGFLLGAAMVVCGFMALSGWWRLVPRRALAGLPLPAPRPLAVLSGIGTAAIIIATTLAYTFHGISIVFALLLMRGGVLIMAPIIDALFRRDVAWNSWVGLGLSLVAVGIALADQNSYVLSLAAVINLAFYYTGYAIRLQCITAAAKSDDPDAKFRYFAEEQTVSMFLLLVGCAALTLYGIQTAEGQFPSIASAVMSMFSGLTVMIGLLYGCLFLFGSMIYMDSRENCFCVPINRCSSVVAGLVATAGMVYAFDQPAVSVAQMVAAGIIITAILFLATPKLPRWLFGSAADVAGHGPILFVCNGNTIRSPIAAAICRSEVARRIASGFMPVDVISAGLRVSSERTMTKNATQALLHLDVPDEPHCARQLTRELVDQASVIYCMSERQRDDLLSTYPQARDKVYCLDHGREILAPIEHTLDEYIACARHIRDSVLHRIDNHDAMPSNEYTSSQQRT